MTRLRIAVLSIAACLASPAVMAGEGVVYLRVIRKICDFSPVMYTVVPTNDGAVIMVPTANVSGLEKLNGPDAKRCYVVCVTPRGAPARYAVHTLRPSKRNP